MRLQKEKIQKKTGYENNFVNNNILRSVNDILNSYDDKFVLSAIYEDILRHLGQLWWSLLDRARITIVFSNF